MDKMLSSLMGGFAPALSEEALPVVVSATNIFANAPSRASYAMLTITGADLRITYNGATPSATVGHLYLQNNTYGFPLNAVDLKQIKAIEVGGTATGYITYFGRK